MAPGPGTPTTVPVVPPQPPPVPAAPRRRTNARRVWMAIGLAIGGLLLLGLLLSRGVLFLRPDPTSVISPPQPAVTLAAPAIPATPIGTAISSLPDSEPSPNGTLIFQDDFDTPSSGAQPRFSRELMTFAPVEGEGRLIGIYTGGVLPVMYAGPKVADFIAEFDIRAESPHPGSTYGLIFRSDDSVDRYYQLALQPADGTAGIAAWKDGGWKVVK